MMKKSNRITAAVMAMALAVFIMTACGGGGAGTNTVETTQATVSAQDSSTAASSSVSQVQTEHVHSHGGADIGLERVQSIVLAKVPGATVSNIYEMERDVDDGRIEYEGSIFYNGYEYEFEVDGATGNILKWEIDD